MTDPRSCPRCGRDVRRPDILPVHGAIRRRYQCNGCRARWSTYEVPASVVHSLLAAARIVGPLKPHQEAA